jgi:modification methylase
MAQAGRFETTDETKEELKMRDQILSGHAAQVMRRLASGSIDCIITSPPYWNAVSDTWPTYETFLDDMQSVWIQAARVLRPNGKLCINAPLMPIPKHVIGDQHIRCLKNIAGDFEQRILSETDLLRYGMLVWQKQNSKLMLGSYPYPGNILECNSIEFINVYVKPGEPSLIYDKAREEEKKERQAANKMTKPEVSDLTLQVWWIMPVKINRKRGDHPAPFPEKLPARLIRMYTYGPSANFPGEIVLDPFAGSGTTCAVAKKLGRRFIGIDIDERFAEMARRRVEGVRVGDPIGDNLKDKDIEKARERGGNLAGALDQPAGQP